MIDLTQDVTYRGFKLNDSSIVPQPGAGIGDGISGCVLDSADFSDVDVVQYREKRSLADGMDAGDVYLGARRLRLAGTLYGRTRELFYDNLASLRACLSATLAFREEPADKGYQPLYFSQPTNRTDDYVSGQIDLRALAMPLQGPSYVIQRDHQGGANGHGIAVPWQATLVMRDPTIQGATAQLYPLTDTVIVSGATATAATNLVNKTAHGLVAGNRIFFVTVGTGGAGLSKGVGYYVIASGLTANAFKVSLTSGGTEVDITSNYTAITYAQVVTTTTTMTNRGNYHVPLNMILAVGATGGTITCAIAGSNFTLTIPASTGTRTIRFKGADKVITVEENDDEELAYSYLTFQNSTTWPMIPAGDTDLTMTTVGPTIDAGATDGSSVWLWEVYA